MTVKNGLLTRLLDGLMKAWHIKHWDTLYESNSSRVVQTLSYFCQPNKLTGEGIGHMNMQPDGLELYGTLTWLKVLASTALKAQRGWLIRNGTPMDAARMAALLRIPQEKIQRALDFFSTTPMDWIEFADAPDSVLSANRQTPDRPPSAGRRQNCKTDDEYSTDEEGTEEERVAPSGNQAAPASVLGTGSLPELPDDRMIFDYAAKFPGEPASGAPQMPVAWVAEFIQRLRGRERLPRDWQAHLVATWRVEFQRWGEDGVGKARKKTAGHGGGESKAQRIFKLDKRAEELVAQIAGFESTQPELAEQLEVELKKVRAEREGLK